VVSAPAATTRAATLHAPLPEPAPTDRRPPWRSRRGLVHLALVAALLVPLLVALAALRSPRWYPLNDLAQTEMRVRDVGSRHPPLIGLVGRMHDEAVQGSHPGPLGYYALWPVHRLLGGSAWALLAASVWIHAVAIAGSIWIASRRGGLRLAIVVAVALAVLTRAYGAELLAVPWNPYLPLLWWVAFLLAVWSVLDDDVALLPIVVLAGSLCAQTHIGYLGTTAALTALAVAWSFVRARRRHPHQWADWSRPALVAGGLGALVWLPPLIEELTAAPGNGTILWHYLLSPDEPPIGLGTGLRVLLVQLDPWRLVTGGVVRDLSLPGRAELHTVHASVWPGSGLLVAWGLAVVVSWRLRHRRLLLLHATLGVTLVLAALNVSRLFGLVWYYLVLWVWGLGALLLVAIVATGAAALRRRPTALRVGAVALTAALVVSTAVFLGQVGSAEVSEPWATRAVDAIVPATVAALTDDSAPDGPYLVTWGDPVYFGSQGWALANELHRAGLDVGTNGTYHGGVMRYRRIGPDEAGAEVHLSIGADIARWRADQGAREVAYVDPRDDRQRAEHARLRAAVMAGLLAAGRTDVEDLVDRNLGVVAVDSGIPDGVRDQARRMTQLGVPTAVFVVPLPPSSR
jgi:hypothetical protein